MIGIGGSGMYPLAQILLAEGYQLTGSDNNPSYTLDSVIKMGVRVFMGHKPENIGEDTQLVVHTAAVFDDNPELVEARRRGIPTMERSVLLGIVANSFADTVAVCGTHGKTTSTAMLTEVLVRGGKDPSAVIGGKLASIGGSGRVGSGEYMSCEACEFRDTFLRIKPAHALILNVDEDHLEYFKTLDNIINSFAKFAAQTGKTVIANGDDANTLEALKRSQTRARTVLFGTADGCEHQGRNLCEQGARFS
ncbi:MAG: UDP-N-acetylmuramate--L-alanine ligase, partial [Clostridia bacterium]|nr:UDP-N-acetylmuramate--L-alanine ligase [Clostridia bacterium]